ncbi:hypothetical protein TRFO_24856 [Tritrichomonas foetus]|uniref:Uncharacterized protein n=1 Tax=Tritrichomonas foetus TaxID=1144522 RepID=A0A1J4K7X2_9EUKA|nr:hypothetical protein TRFO_24856 [Tritrichomonas foetus]|eukprot:OHT06976.1 hypothetical protein TRFO_24856 [Tritrichomonas foetus]
MDNSFNTHEKQRISSIKIRKMRYSRIPGMIELSKTILSTEENREHNLEILYRYVSSITGEELNQFGKKFPFANFFNFFTENQESEFGFCALSILSLATYSGVPKRSFYTSSFPLCSQLLTQSQYTKFILDIFINGADYYEQNAILYLRNNICEIISSLPITQETAHFISVLSKYSTEYLGQLFTLTMKIINSLDSQERIQQNIHIIFYVFRSIHYQFYNNHNNDETCQQISNSISDFILNNSNIFFSNFHEPFMRSYYKVLSHLPNLPPIFGQTILEAICNLNVTKWKEAGKTIRVAMLPFQTHVNEWQSTLSEVLFEVIFSKFVDQPYDIRMRIFCVLSQYYQYNTINKYTFHFLEWCLYFLRDKETCEMCLEKIHFVLAIMSKNGTFHSEIIQILQSEMTSFEEICEDENEKIAILSSSILEMLSTIME